MLREVRECDWQDEGPCVGPVSGYCLSADGDRQAQALDLCERHLAPVKRVFARAVLVDLPTRPRARMEATKLRVTEKTGRLKKRGLNGQEDEGA